MSSLLSHIWGPRRLRREFLQRFRPLQYRTRNRYDAIISEVARLKPLRLLEIGACKGDTAERLIRASVAAAPGSKISYRGFDLFEAISADISKLEAAKPASPLDAVRRRLDAIAPAQVDVQLYAGNTTETLPAAGAEMEPFDLIFIDGGHSESTVASDWQHCSQLAHPGSVIFFDDYPRWGVGPVVDAIDPERWTVEILEPGDAFQVDGETVRSKLARVYPRS